MSLHFYSRWKFVDELIPLLKKAEEEGQEVRVMSVLSPGSGGPLDADNLGVKKKYTFSESRKHTTTYNDLMVEEYASRHPKMSFIHIFPGFVNTNIGKNLHWTMRPLMSLANIIGTSLDDCGQYMLSALVSPEYRQGAYHLDSRADPMSPEKIHTSEEARAKLVEHFTKEAAVA